MLRKVFFIAMFSFSLIHGANGFANGLSNEQYIKEKINIEHSGRTDKDGCHRNRKTGTRHCH